MSLSLQDARDLDQPRPIPNSSRVLGLRALSLPLLSGKLFASTDLQYVGQRRTLQGNQAKPYVLPNFTLYSPRTLKGWELSASVYNAFNETVGDPASVAHVQDVLFQNRRNFGLRFTYHF